MSGVPEAANLGANDGAMLCRQESLGLASYAYEDQRGQSPKLMQNLYVAASPATMLLFHLYQVGLGLGNKIDVGVQFASRHIASYILFRLHPKSTLEGEYEKTSLAWLKLEDYNARKKE